MLSSWSMYIRVVRRLDIEFMIHIDEFVGCRRLVEYGMTHTHKPRTRNLSLSLSLTQTHTCTDKSSRCTHKHKHSHSLSLLPQARAHTVSSVYSDMPHSERAATHTLSHTHTLFPSHAVERTWCQQHTHIHSHTHLLSHTHYISLRTVSSMHGDMPQSERDAIMGEFRG